MIDSGWKFEIIHCIRFANGALVLLIYCKFRVQTWCNMSHPIDIFVGEKIRHRRWQIGLTQHELARKVGVKFQQIQKYECATNRVSASRLWEIATAQSVPISYYFQGTGNDGSPESLTSDIPEEFLHSKEIAVLVRSYFDIPTDRRKKFLELLRSLC